MNVLVDLAVVLYPPLLLVLFLPFDWTLDLGPICGEDLTQPIVSRVEPCQDVVVDHNRGYIEIGDGGGDGGIGAGADLRLALSAFDFTTRPTGVVSPGIAPGVPAVSSSSASS